MYLKSISIIAVAFILCSSAGCTYENHKEHKSEHAHLHKNQDKADYASDGHSSEEIKLSTSAAARFGVKVEQVIKSPFHDVLKVSGTILPSPNDAAVITTPVAGIVNFKNNISLGSTVQSGTLIASVKSSDITGGDVNLAAKATYDAAKRELDRIKPLYEERLVTASDYNNALRAYEEARATYSPGASSGNVSALIGGVITSIDVTNGQYVNAGDVIATVCSSSKLTLKADVPEKYYQRIASISGASIKMPYSNVAISLGNLGGRRVSGPAVASSTPGYIPLYFSFDNDGSVMPGASADVFLLGKEEDEVITVPLTALSEQQGLLYVFVQLDDECYKKVLVKTGRNDGSRVEIISGLIGGENVVVEGTTTVRIAEASGVVPEGHNHNH